MATVIVSSYDVANFPEGGGHFWAYMQYILGLRRAGCDVYWMEQFRPSGDRVADQRAVATFFERARAFGLDARVLLYVLAQDGPSREWLGVSADQAESALRRADLVLNFHYAIDPSVLADCRRTALMDIDPGLLQLWISTGELVVPPHDVYMSIGETVGTPGALFPDCGLNWIHCPRAIDLESWPVSYDPSCEAFTTVASWWSGLWVKVMENGTEELHENTKRAAFLPFADLPQHTSQPLEMALYLADSDTAEQRMLESHGWRIRHSREVAGTPQMYQEYVQRSRGEFSCAKPYFVRLQTAWVSDRTLCYLASGKPVVVQDTGPSALPSGAGLFRFSTVAEAAAALDAINENYEGHCRAARDLAETWFDATRVAERILDAALATAEVT